MKNHAKDRNKHLARAMRLAADATEDLTARGIEVMAVCCLGRLPVLTLRWSPACKGLGGERIGRGGSAGERYVRREAPYHGVTVRWDEPDNRPAPITGFLGLGRVEVRP
jgi:hypothetical protein